MVNRWVNQPEMGRGRDEGCESHAVSQTQGPTTMSIGNPDAQTFSRAASPERPGVWSRVYAAMIGGRMRKAQDDINLYRHLLPRDLEKAATRSQSIAGPSQAS